MKKHKKIIISSLFFLGLACNSFAELPTNEDMAYVLPQADIFMRKEQPFGHYLGFSTDGGNLVGVIFLTTEIVPDETWGYRDQIVTLVGVNSWGKITGVKILKENETPRYTRNLLNDDSWFLDQFKGKDAEDDFLLGKDVDAITGATISSSSIVRAIEAGLDIVSKRILNKNVENDTPVKHFVFYHLLWQINFIFLWIITGMALISFFKKSRVLRYLTLGVSIVYIGFIKGGGFSIIDIFNLGSLNLPVFMNNLYWYSLVILVIGLTIMAGRFYCGWLCPFGAATEVLYKLIPAKYTIPRNIDTYLKLVKYIIFFFLIFMYFAFANKDLAIYLSSIIEPFATFFKLYGGLIAWGWLIFMLICSIFISRLFCKYFCPLGAFFALLSRLSSFLKIKKLNVNLPQKDCKGCRMAERTCQMGAISYDASLNFPEIDSAECFMCNTCTTICPIESRAKEKEKR